MGELVLKYAILALAIVAAGIADNRLIELLKVLGIVNANNAERVNNVLAVLLGAAPVLLGLFGLDVPFLDALAANDAQVDKVLDALIAIAGQIPVAALISFVAAWVHDKLKKAQIGLVVPKG